MRHYIGTKRRDEVHQWAVTYVKLLHPHLARQVSLPARRHIVDNEHIVAAGHQPVDDVRADEPRPTGHEYSHCSSFNSNSSHNQYDTIEAARQVYVPAALESTTPQAVVAHATTIQ